MSEEKKQADPFAVLEQMRAINQADTRPRFRACPVLVGGERLRLRRLQFMEILAMKTRLRAADFRPGSDRPITAKQRGELLHLVQISLVPQTGSGLRFAGHEGRVRLGLLLDVNQIEGLGLALVDWNDIFDDVEKEADEKGATSTLPAVPSVDPPSL